MDNQSNEGGNRSTTGQWCKRRSVLQTAGVLGGVSLLSQSTAAQKPSTELSSQTDLELIFQHTVNESYSDQTGNGVTGDPADENIGFTTDGDRDTVAALSGRGSSGGYYDIPYELLTDLIARGDPVAVAFWMKPERLDRWYSVINGFGAGVVLRDSELRLQRYNRETGGTDFRAAVAATDYLTANEWTHIVGTVEPGTEARLFVDGELAAVETVDEDQGYTEKSGLEQARVGWVPSSNDGAYDAHFTGAIDDVRLYKNGVDATTAQQLYTEDDQKESDAEITITSLSSSSPVTAGDSLDVDVSVENVGDLDGTQHIVLESIDGEEVDTDSISLQAGETTTTTLTWETDSDDTADGKITVRSGDSELTESLLIESQRTAQVTVSLAAPTEVEPEESFEVEGTAENIGDDDSTGEITLSVDGQPVDTVDTVVAGETVNLQATVEAGENGDTHDVLIESQDDSRNTVVEVGEMTGSQTTVSLETPEEAESGESFEIQGIGQNTGDVTDENGVELLVDDEVVESVTPVTPGETVRLEATVEAGENGDTHSVSIKSRYDAQSTDVSVGGVEKDEDGICEGAPTMARNSITAPQNRITADEPARIEANFRVDQTVPAECTVIVDLQYSFAQSGFQFGGGSGWDQSATDVVTTRFDTLQAGEIRSIDAEIQTNGANVGDEVTVVADYEIWYDGDKENALQQSGIQETITVEGSRDSNEDEDTDGGTSIQVPGFGIGETLAAVGSAGYMVKRRLGTEDSET